ncbi:MAG TPA: hypothetical protein VFY85_06995 [Gemmatimonadaceae bacterium]|nr:hypothetical protein [Gemmatimonadaceae bacterium]
MLQRTWRRTTRAGGRFGWARFTLARALRAQAPPLDRLAAFVTSHESSTLFRPPRVA